MPNLMQEMIEAAKAQAMEECLDLSQQLIDGMLGADGFTVGDHALDRGERIARFDDFASRGVLDVLKTISPSTHDMLVRQQVKDVGEALAGHNNAPLPSGQSWFGLEGTPPGEIEVERSFLVHADPYSLGLPQLPQPWLLIQGYRDPEHSLRVITARRMAYARIKQPGTLSMARQKWSQPVDYSQAVRVMGTLPRIATKARYLVRDEFGRAWLLDHITTAGDHWIAETEIPKGADPDAIQLPKWVSADVTNKATGYTWNYAVPMTGQDLTQALAEAQRGGNTGAYTPSEDPTFQWLIAPDATPSAPPPEAQRPGLVGRFMNMLRPGR